MTDIDPSSMYHWLCSSQKSHVLLTALHKVTPLAVLEDEVVANMTLQMQKCSAVRCGAVLWFRQCWSDITSPEFWRLQPRISESAGPFLTKN